MRQPIKPPGFPHPLRRSRATGLALAGVPASAQSRLGSHRHRPHGRHSDIRSLSQAVDYADLDLTTRAGADTLKFRIKATATQLCEQLGESGSSTGPVPSCEDAATTDAMKQARIAIASATPWARQPWPPPGRRIRPCRLCRHL